MKIYGNDNFEEDIHISIQKKDGSFEKVVSIDGKSGDVKIEKKLTLESIPEIIKDLHPVGMIMQSLMTEEQFISTMGEAWVLADGRDVSDSIFAGVGLGSTVPDMRGKFLRSYGGKSSELGKEQGFATSTDGLSVSVNCTETSTELFSRTLKTLAIPSVSRAGVNLASVVKFTQKKESISHKHSISASISSPGDETRPVNVAVNTFIKIN